MIPFSNMQIKEIAHILEQLYDYKIIVNSKLDNKRTYTGVIKRSKDIRTVLDGLSYTISFHYTMNNKEITLTE
jgi:putative anti-sigma factor